MNTIKRRLEYLRGELRAQRISYEELVELNAIASHIDPGDVELLEAAGIPESFENADARLTAAAPDMLDALEAILPFLDEHRKERTLQSAAKYGGTTYDAREAVRAAIAKAKG